MLPSDLLRPWFALLVLVSFGCDASTRGPTEVQPIALDDFARALDERYCRLAVDCGETRDYATCKAAIDHAGLFAPARCAIEAGTFTYDGLAASECMQALDIECTRTEFAALLLPTGSSCDDTNCPFRELAMVFGIDQVFASEACRSIFETDPACHDGACEGPAPTIVGTGESCGDGFACRSTEYCTNVFSPISPGTCRPYAARGEPCDFGAVLCQPGLTCVVTGAGGSTCEVLAAEGAACSDDTEVHVGVPCDRMDNRCSHDTWTCVPRLRDGTRCSHSEQCERDSYCETNDYRCVPRPSLGEACSDTATDDARCLDRTACDSAGVCIQVPSSFTCP